MSRAGFICPTKIFKGGVAYIHISIVHEHNMSAMVHFCFIAVVTAERDVARQVCDNSQQVIAWRVVIMNKWPVDCNHTFINCCNGYLFILTFGELFFFPIGCCKTNPAYAFQ